MLHRDQAHDVARADLGSDGREDAVTLDGPVEDRGATADLAVADLAAAADQGPTLTDGGLQFVDGGTTLVSDFSLTDVNPNSSTFNSTVSPRSFLGKVSAYYFAQVT